MTDIDTLYAQFHAEENCANYWQKTANEKALEIAQLLNERQEKEQEINEALLLAEGPSNLRDLVASFHDRGLELNTLREALNDIAGADETSTLEGAVAIANHALALVAPKEGA